MVKLYYREKVLRLLAKGPQPEINLMWQLGLDIFSPVALSHLRWWLTRMQADGLVQTAKKVWRIHDGKRLCEHCKGLGLINDGS